MHGVLVCSECGEALQPGDVVLEVAPAFKGQLLPAHWQVQRAGEKPWEHVMRAIDVPAIAVSRAGQQVDFVGLGSSAYAARRNLKFALDCHSRAIA